MKKLSTERKGEILVMADVVIFALFPIIASFTTKIMPPILFAALSLLMAALTAFIYMLLKKEIKEIFNKKAIKYVLGVTLFIVSIPSIFIYTGASKTSGINTAILMQTEIFFTFLIVGRFTDESITLKKILASLLIAIGAVAVLFNGNFEVNWGDLLIIGAGPFYPIGNIFAKKALKLTSAAAILFYRGFVGGIVLLFISLLFENYDLTVAEYFSNNLELILINGILIYFVSKMIWYAGLEKLDISKAIPMLMSHPALGLVYAYIFLKEIPSFYQLIGFAIVMGGVYTITIKAKASPIVEPE